MRPVANQLLVFGLLLASSAACATGGDIERLQGEHERITQRQDEFNRRITALEDTMERLQELLQAIRADFKADLGAVRRQMNAVESAIRGTETRLEQLRRVAPPPQPVPAEEEAEGPEERADDGAPVVDQVALYNSAITDYQQGRLDLAFDGFSEYLRLFPRGLSAPDAQYWIGIIHYDRGSYDLAVRELRRVPELYGGSSKAPLALRKIGDAFRALGDEERARAAYDELIRRYPNSVEAQAARRELGT